MGISGFFPINRQTARFGIKLFISVWLLSCLPAMAQTANGFGTRILISQRQSLLREGDRGPAVRELQRGLNRSGLFPATTIDGVYGPETTQAVRQFQRIRRLDVTGVADEDTLDSLDIDLNLLSGLSHPVHGFISGDRITPDSSVEDVRTLQLVMRTFGFDLDADGIYGAQTLQAVRAYERTAGISPVDGIADRNTLIDMGFSDNGSRRNSRRSRRDNDDVRTVDIETLSDNSLSPDGRFVAAIITRPSELATIRQDFPDATVERNGLGEYISLGRFFDSSEAGEWVDAANALGYDARVLRD